MRLNWIHLKRAHHIN